MSGHSKWSKIKRQKEVTDKVKGATFAKLSRFITLAVVEGGGLPDPENNVRLRLAIENAKALNMPKENIIRAIEKGSGPNKEALKEVVYEAFAPLGVALMIQVATDNTNRTFAEIRTALERNGGKIGSKGAVSYLFDKCALVIFETDDEGAVMSIADQLKAIDINQDEDSFTVYFPFENLGKVNEYTQNLEPKLLEQVYRPQTTISLPEIQTGQVISLIEHLEEMDDVQNVFSNLS